MIRVLIRRNGGLNLQKELQNIEEEQNKKVRGFREVIDLISASQKPVVSHNSLNGVSLHKYFLITLDSSTHN